MPSHKFEKAMCNPLEAIEPERLKKSAEEIIKAMLPKCNPNDVMNCMTKIG